MVSAQPTALPLARAARRMLLGISCLLVPSEAGGDLFKSLKGLKPSSRLLEQGSHALAAAAAAAAPKNGAVAKAAGAVEKAAGDLKPKGLGKVKVKELPGDLVKDAVDLKKVQHTFNAINPELADTLRNRIQSIDPEEIDDVIQAIGLLHWCRHHWYLLVLAVLCCPAGIALYAWRRGRQKRPCVVMEQSDTCLLQTEGEVFARAALVC
mmetsp:Transcript_135910/g.338969  ORF Transcript_135910/g.338969 Transcript_135910/m.338969 type:complete len:209 (-) Transcript_135910:7-633(-)